MALIQRRRGPNVVGSYGVLQPFADALKLLLKESIFPLKSNYISFVLSPWVSLTTSLINWAFISWSELNPVIELEYTILILFAISSLGSYGILLAGWSSNSKYAILGSLRTAAQYLSYEIVIGLVILGIFTLTQSLNISQIVLFQRNIWLIGPLFPLGLIFFIAVLAETNRTPFDLPEAESELVAGFGVEYGAVMFVTFFLSEYSNILMMSFLFTDLFLGGGYIFPFGSNHQSLLILTIKSLLIVLGFIWIRISLPRYRYDQLMALSWLKLIPIAFGYLFFTIGCVVLL